MTKSDLSIVEAKKIGDGQGVYVGHSVSTGCAKFLNLKASADNQNILIVGASGDGMCILYDAQPDGTQGKKSSDW